MWISGMSISGVRGARVNGSVVSLRRCLCIVAQSTVVLDEVKITGSLISVH